MAPLYYNSLVETVATAISGRAHKLAEAFCAESLTIDLKKKNNITDLITAAKDSVTVHVPNCLLTLALFNQQTFC